MPRTLASRRLPALTSAARVVLLFSLTLIVVLLSAGRASAEASKQGASTAGALAHDSKPMPTPSAGAPVTPAPTHRADRAHRAHHATAKAKPKSTAKAKPAAKQKPNAKPAVAHPHAAAVAKPKKGAPAHAKPAPAKAATAAGPRQRA